MSGQQAAFLRIRRFSIVLWVMISLMMNIYIGNDVMCIAMASLVAESKGLASTLPSQSFACLTDCHSSAFNIFFTSGR